MRGKAHLSPEDHSAVMLASNEAVRFVMLLSTQTSTVPLESRSPLWLLELKLLVDEDAMQCSLASDSLLRELENNPKRLIFSQEVSTMIGALNSRIKKFETSYKDLSKNSKKLKIKSRELHQAKKEFVIVLYEVAHVGRLPALL
jgi:hypothetical protein